MLPSFLACLLSGQYARWGAEANGHTSTLTAQKVTRLTGTCTYAPVWTNRELVDGLRVGERFHRVWSCSKPGFLRIFGLDSWKHHEVIRRDSDTSLVITDKLVWHSGRSTAQRKWGVRSCESGGLVRTEGKWHIAMNGVRWPVRGRVEAAMRGALPAAAEGNMAAFFRSRALPSPEEGSRV